MTLFRSQASIIWSHSSIVLAIGFSQRTCLPASAIFTTTADINAEYPAIAARKLGWRDVALLCSHEMDVPHGLHACLRILIHWNTDKSPQDIVHVYVEEAQSLRPDMFDQEGGKA